LPVSLLAQSLALHITTFVVYEWAKLFLVQKKKKKKKHGERQTQNPTNTEQIYLKTQRKH